MQLQFWDVTRPVQGYEEASLEQIKSIWNFIQANKNKNIFAHCEAGVSRSAAIREYLLRRGWTIDNFQQRRQVFPNIYVLTELERLDR